MEKRTIKSILLCITYALVMLFVLLNFSSVWGILSNFVAIIMPFVYGFAIAYILKFLYEFFRQKAFAKMGTKRKIFKSLKTPLSLICTYIIAFGIVAFLIGSLIPQIIDSIKNITDNMGSYIQSFQKAENDVITWINSTFGLELKSETLIDTLLLHILDFVNKNDFASMLQSFMNSAFPVVINATKTATVEIYNWIIAIIVSVYYLASKDKLCSQVSRLAKAYIPKKHVEKTFYIARLSNDMCGRFLVGKIIDSTIIGLLCFICMSIFRFDYALLISVIVGVTNIIPFFGPFIGAIPSAILLLLVDPVQCFWFVVFILVLQQIDGNIIGPRVLGESVGVSGFWIMASVIIGGGLFGVAGMVLGVPVFAVIYTLIGDSVNKRLKVSVPKLTADKTNTEINDDTDVSEQAKAEEKK